MSVQFSGSEQKREAMKRIIQKLHDGASVESVKKEFKILIKDAGAEEIAEMEQSLVDNGFPPEEIMRMCDVHVQVFESSLKKGEKPHKIPGHPVHTFMAENKEAKKRAKLLVSAAKSFARTNNAAGEFGAALADLKKIITHFERKENQLFPFLEHKGFTAPSKVMWGKHDEIRGVFKAAEAALEHHDGKAALACAKDLQTRLAGMKFMEERILYPNALKRLSDQDWVSIRAGEDAIGYAWVRPGAEWDTAIVAAKFKESRKTQEAKDNTKTSPGGAGGSGSYQEAGSRNEAGRIPLNTGAIDAELIDLMLRSLPLDVSIVDENDKVVYYSDSPERVFPRSPGVIGRDVRNCHPQKSVATVEAILAAFKAKEKKSAKFWIEMGGKFIVIEYIALYGKDGSYRGTLEMTQDATGIRKLEGQRRLLDF